MVPIESFLSRLLPQVPACPEPYAVQALLDSAIEFCDKSLILRYNLTPFTTIQNEPSYVLEPPNVEHSTIARVLHVRFGDKNLVAMTREESTKLGRNTVANPTHYFSNQYGADTTIELYPAPSEVNDVVVHVALKPSRSANLVDEILYNSWTDAILAGALTRICKTPNQPFTDIRFAAAMGESFASKIAQARNESYYGRVRGNLSVTMRPFA